MKFRKPPIALAALALCGAMPLGAQAAPTVSWIAPQSGATLQGTVSGSACAINASSDVVMAQFWANDAQINNDYSAPYNCTFEYNGNVGISGSETNGTVGTPVYAAGNGWQVGSGGMHQLDPSSPGYGTALRLPNFKDQYATPDIGAHQSGTAAMKFGVNQ